MHCEWFAAAPWATGSAATSVDRERTSFIVTRRAFEADAFESAFEDGRERAALPACVNGELQTRAAGVQDEGVHPYAAFRMSFGTSTVASPSMTATSPTWAVVEQTTSPRERFVSLISTIVTHVFTLSPGRTGARNRRF